MCVFADGGEGLVDGVHGDGALGDVDDGLAEAVAEEADGVDFSLSGFLEVGCDFRAVVPFLG